MKKVLLIGGLGEIVRSLNECLIEEFQVQLCPAQLENAEAITKIIRPDVLIFCNIGTEKNQALWSWLKDKSVQKPVVIVTTEQDYKENLEAYAKERFAVLLRPVMKQELLNVCHRLLKLAPIVKNEVKEQPASDRKKLLLVDDSALMLRSLKAMLEKTYDLCLAKSGKQALQVIQREAPDLVLLDYEMEEMDGKAVFEAMRADAQMKQIPVVFLTNVSDRSAIYSVLKSKPDGYILKPPDEKRIFQTLEELLG